MKIPLTTGVVTLLAVFSLMFMAPAPGQTEGGGPTVIPEIQHVTSPPLRELVQAAPRAVAPRVIPLRRIPSPQRKAVAPQVPDPVVQESAGPLVSTTNLLNFDGIAADGFIPPDTNGSVGATQFVETVNIEFAVYNKSNGALLLGPTNFSTLFSTMPMPGLCSTGNLSDPIVLYDKAAGRWLLSIVAFDNTFSSSFECIAVSTSSDATGSYNLYSFSFGSNLNDYPKFGVWPDAYYFSAVMFANGTTFMGPQACAFPRSAMLAGNSASMICFQLGTSDGVLMPSDLDGSTQPPAGEPNFFVELATNSLNLFKFHVDFTTPINSTFTGPTNIPVAVYTQACFGGTCIPQLGTLQQLDSLGDRLMFRLAYRNFGDHESLVVNHSVQVDPMTGQSGVRWYEIRDPNGTPTVSQQSTFAPDTSFRWMGSIAMDHAGDMTVGYSVSSTSLNPQIQYTGRLPGDPPNTMETEATIMTGSGSQVGFSRWGDYTSMSIDPLDDCTFWYANEYYSSQANGSIGNWQTRIGSFKFLSCGPKATLNPTSVQFNNQLVNTTSTTSNVQLTNSGTATLNIASIILTGNDPTQFALVAPTSGSPCSFGAGTITAGNSCFLGVQFKPTTTGARSASVSVTDDASGSPQLVSLTGTGIAPALTLSVPSVAFGSVNVGGTVATSNVQLTNSGTATLNIASIMLTGTDTSQFALVAPTSGSPACSFGASTITAGNWCFLGVQFKPTTAGARSANVSVADDASGSPQTVALAGTGMDFSIGPATGGSTSATITAGQTAPYNLQVSPVGGFNGTVTLSCSGAPSLANCTASPASVTPNGTVASAFTVSVTTTAPSMIVPRTGPPNWPPLTGLRLILLLLFALALLAILGRFRDAAKLPRPGLALAPALALVLLILAWAGGCGGGGYSAPRNPGTPQGTSTLTVTATSGGLSHTQNLTLTVN